MAAAEEGETGREELVTGELKPSGRYHIQRLVDEIGVGLSNDFTAFRSIE